VPPLPQCRRARCRRGRLSHVVEPAGQLPVDHTVLRKINTVMGLLPVMNSPQFQDAYLVARAQRALTGCCTPGIASSSQARRPGLRAQEYNDTLLINYVAFLTKVSMQVSELVDHFSLANEKTARRGRGGL